MRKINAKLFLALLIGVVVCTGAVFGIHHFQYGRIADSLLWQARHAEEQGQIKRQAKYLQRYLEFNPKDLDAKARLATLWAGEAFADSPRQRLKAVRLFDEVLTRGEDKPELRRLLVKSALEVQQLKDARTHLEKLLPEKQLKQSLTEPIANAKADPQRGEAEGYWGELLSAENKPTEAVACCRLAVRHAPNIQANYITLAQLLRRQKEIDPSVVRKNEREANEALDELVAHNPLSHEAYLSRWRYRRQFGLISLKTPAEKGQLALKDAANDVAQALQRAPESVDVLLAAADLERLEGQASFSVVASREKEKSLAEHRNKALAYLNQALKLHAKGGKVAAVDATQFQLLWHKANLLLDDIERLAVPRSGDTPENVAERRQEWSAEVVQAIEKIRKTRGTPTSGDYLKARLLLLDRRWAEAATLFESVRPTLGTQADLASQINLYLGQCYEQLVEPAQMFNAYERLRQTEPNSVAAVLGVAQAEWSMGHLDKAAEKFAQLAVAGKMPDKVWLDYTRLEIQRQMMLDRPDWSVVENLLGYAEKANPKSVDVPLTRAQMWMAQEGKQSLARKTLEDALKVQPEAIELWTARVYLELRDGRYAKAQEFLKEAKAKLGDRVLLRLAESRYLAETMKTGVAAAIDRLADDIEKFNEDDQARLLSGLADSQLNLDDVKRARHLWQRVAKLPSHRADLPLHLLLFDMAVKAEDEADMRRTLDDIRTLEGNQGPFHRYGEALRLIWQARKNPEKNHKPLDEARAHLDRVQSQRPTWAPLFLARAQIDRLSNRDDEAIGNLQEALRNGERSPAVIRELVELLSNNDRYKEADEALRYLREPALVNSDLGRLATVVALHRGNTARATDLLNKNRSPEDSKNYRELLWEGRQLAEMKKIPEAEKKLREALRLADKEPEPYVALVQFLTKQKREQEADPLLQQAKEKLPPERVELALGQCYEVLGRGKSAQAQYEQALDGHRRDATIVRRVAGFYWNSGQLLQAETLLRDIVEKRVESPSTDDATWARWHLALVLAGGTDYGRFREALRLVGLKLDGNGQLLRDPERERADSTDARRFQARVLASQAGHRGFRQRSLELLEGLERNKALRPDDRFILSMLYEAGGSWQKAKPILVDLVREREPAPRHLAFFVQTLIEHKELDEAETMTDKLEVLEQRIGSEPNAFAAVELRARLLEVRGKGDAALRKLEALIRRDKAKPEEVLLVLNSMRRQKRFAEALERCAKVWQEKKCSPQVIGGACVALLRGMQANGSAATDAQVSLIENHLQEALKAQTKTPDKAVLMLHLADLFDQRGRWEDAEAMYRQVLHPENEPKNVVALNNLAWLMAQRSSDTAKVQEALTKIESAVNGIGRRADLLDTRGLVYLKLGQESAALADFREASADMPTPAHLFHLARAHYQARDKSNAYKILKQAKENGLQANVLHPVEQKSYQELLDQLKVH